MPISHRPRPIRLLLTTALILATRAFAQQSGNPDFTGIWQLDDKQSDSAADISQRLHREQHREEAPHLAPASASSSGSTPAANNAGHGGGHGMGGGGGGGMGGMGGGMGGHGGGHHGKQNNGDSGGSNNAAPKDPVPHLFADDNLLNVQQGTRDMQVDFSNTDRLNLRFDGQSRQSLNSSARVQGHLAPGGMEVSMLFDDGTSLDESWVRSADGHHLTVTETWSNGVTHEPIVFVRRYNRLDM